MLQNDNDKCNYDYEYDVGQDDDDDCVNYEDDLDIEDGRTSQPTVSSKNTTSPKTKDNHKKLPKSHANAQGRQHFVNTVFFFKYTSVYFIITLKKSYGFFFKEDDIELSPQGSNYYT